MKLIAATLLVALLAGCATPARMEQMTAQVAPSAMASADARLKGAIAVADVTGGKDTNPMWTSQVSSETFRQSLEASLTQAGLFSKVLSAGKYTLTADLLKLDQPLVGLNMTVGSTVRYSLIDVATKKEVYGKTLTVSYTAKMSDAFVGTERLRLANEGAIRENIKALMNDLVTLKLN